MPLVYRQLAQPNAEPVSLTQALAHLRVDFTQDNAYIQGLITAARQYIERETNRAIFNRPMILTLDYFPWPGWGSTNGSSAYDGYMESYYRGLAIRLPMPSTYSVESISYIPTNASEPVTIAPVNYSVDLISEPARITPAPGYTWPYQQNYIPGQVQILYTAGSYEVPATPAQITVPATAPYTVTPSDTLPVVTITGVTDANGNPAVYTNNAGTLTFAATEAGATLNLAYTTSNCPWTLTAAILLLVGHLYEHRSQNSEVALKSLPFGIADLIAGETIDSFRWQ